MYTLYMTDWKHHLAYGSGIELVAAVCLFLYKYTQLSYVIIIEGVIIILVSPLIMDLDHRNSKLREVFVGGGLICSIIGYYTKIQKLLSFSLFFSTVSFFICYFTKHRGILHSLPFVVIYGSVLYFITRNVNLTLIGSVGCYSHLFFDKLYFKMW